MAIYMMREPPLIYNYTYDTYSSRGTNITLYYGVKFSPSKNCNLYEIGFLSQEATQGELKLFINGTLNNTWSLDTTNTSGGKYRFSSPISVNSGDTCYLIFKLSDSTKGAGVKSSASYPITGDTIQYTKGINNSTGNYNDMQEINNYTYIVRYIATD